MQGGGGRAEAGRKEGGKRREDGEKFYCELLDEAPRSQEHMGGVRGTNLAAETNLPPLRLLSGRI